MICATKTDEDVDDGVEQSYYNQICLPISTPLSHRLCSHMHIRMSVGGRGARRNFTQFGSLWKTLSQTIFFTVCSPCFDCKYHDADGLVDTGHASLTRICIWNDECSLMKDRCSLSLSSVNPKMLCISSSVSSVCLATFLNHFSETFSSYAYRKNKKKKTKIIRLCVKERKEKCQNCFRWYRFAEHRRQWDDAGKADTK